jgi:hypothetical protein
MNSPRSLAALLLYAEAFVAAVTVGSPSLHAAVTIIDLGTLGGDTSAPMRLLYSNGAMQDSGVPASSPGTFSSGNVITSAGQVVRLYLPMSDQARTFLYHTTSGMAEPNSLFPSSTAWTLQNATAVNDKRNIVGWGTINGKQRALLLTGTTQPLTVGYVIFQYDEMGNLKAIVPMSGPPPQTPIPQFAPASGPLTCGQAVTVTDADAAAAIYYTVDGSPPTTSSTRYIKPIQVDHTETITAFAADPQSGATPSQAVKTTYACTPAAQPGFVRGHITYVWTSPGGGALRIGLDQHINFPGSCEMNVFLWVMLPQGVEASRFVDAVLTAYSTKSQVSIWVSHCSADGPWGGTHPVPDDIYVGGGF